jgi:glycosyltransferase involved in cell wall biosynthesis
VKAIVSILVLAKNEEPVIAGCLESVSWSDDLHVFDSFSTDRTVEIARSYGALIHQRRFDDFANQRNVALQTVRYKYPWVLVLDADERIPAALATEIAGFVETDNGQTSACRIRRRDYFEGQWLKHASISPYFIRLVRPEKVSYHRPINEVLTVDGKIRDLRESFDHYPFAKGLSSWNLKHELYSTMEAKVAYQSRQGNGAFSIQKAIWSRDFNERRFHQKGLFYRLPFRPILKWLYMMSIRGAFLDGRPGITYAFLQSFYEYMIVLKTRELERRSAQMK